MIQPKERKLLKITYIGLRKLKKKDKKFSVPVSYHTQTKLGVHDRTKNKKI